jgi:hypothetical protein
MKTAAEEKALQRYPINQWGIHTTIADRNLNRLLRESHIEGWNDRDSLVEAEKKEAVREFKGALLNYILENVEYGEVYKIIDLLTPEDK